MTLPLYGFTLSPYHSAAMVSADVLFSIANPMVLPGWLLLLAAPRWTWSLKVVRGLLVPLLAVGYSALILARFGTVDGGFDSLAAVQLLFADPHMVVAGWVHYLAFDLFIGAWIVEDAVARQVPGWLRVAVLPLTFLFGPVGLLVYLAGRTAYGRRTAP